MTRRAFPALGDRSGSESDDCMFDQRSVAPRSRLNITRMHRNSSAMSGQRLTIARTVNLCLSFFGLGLCFMMPTATITGLQYRTSSSEDKIEYIYTARYGGYIVGGFIGGFLFNCYNRQFLLFMSLLATAIGILITPFCGILTTLMICTSVTGVTMGLLDTGGNVWLLDIWGRKSAPFMQMMHFCFGLGALVAPLVAQPFIGPYNALDIQQSVTGSHSIFSPMGPHFANKPMHSVVKRDNTEQILSHLTTLPSNITTIQPQVNVTTVLPTTPIVTTSATQAIPKKPHFADSKKINDKWERKLNNSLRVKPTTNTTTTTKAPTPTTPKSTTSASTSISGIPSSSENSTSPTRNDLPTVSRPSTTDSATTVVLPTSPTPSISTFSTTSIAPSMAAKITSEHSTTVATISTTVAKLPEKAENNSTENETTTKLTASTASTEKTESMDAVTAVTRKHHSIKKVLSDDEQQDSWLEQTRKKIQKSGRFEIAYGILAGYIFVVSIVFLLFLCMNPREAKSKQEEDIDGFHQSSRMHRSLIILMCLFFFLYMGLEVAVAETLRSLLQQDAEQTLTGEQLVYSFWGSFAIARGMAIFISMSVSCRSMLIVDMVLCVVASLILVFGAQYPYILLLGIVILAAGMASIIPTSFIWLERYTQVTNRRSALLILSSAAGEMVLPELTSAFIWKTPIELVYVILTVILLCSINLVALCYVTSVRGEKYLTKPDRSLYQLASLDDDLELWNNTRKSQFEDIHIKRNKSNTFFYDRLNNIDS